MISIHRILALVYRDMLIIKRSKLRIFEILYFPLTTTLLWVFFALYSKTFAVEAGILVLVVNIFWNFAGSAQGAVNMQLMEDSWSGSLKQLFLSGVSDVEYAIGRMGTAVIISVPVLIIMLSVILLTSWDFSKAVFPIIMISVLTLIAALSLATMISGLIIVLGRDYGFLAWTALQAFIMLSAPFFPKEIFPPPFSWISYIMPFTYIFEAARNLASSLPVHFLPAIISAGAYFIAAWPVYLYFFKLARRNGNLVKIS
jgi:ABC-2 type transport system permease protein